MSIIDLILKKKKPQIWHRFVALGMQRAPENIDPPRTPEDAMTLGYRLGLQAGYGEGLADGVGLGLDVGTYSAAYAPVFSSAEPVDILN